MRYITSS